MQYVTGVLYVSTPSAFTYNCYVTSTWCRSKLAIFTTKISSPPPPKHKHTNKFGPRPLFENTQRFH